MDSTFQVKHRQFCMFYEYPARLRELNALTASLEEDNSQLRFEFLYLFGEPWLGQVEAGCGPREIKLIGQNNGGLKETKINLTHGPKTPDETCEPRSLTKM
jgi:hypothetical protein